MTDTISSVCVRLNDEQSIQGRLTAFGNPASADAPVSLFLIDGVVSRVQFVGSPAVVRQFALNLLNELNAIETASPAQREEWVNV